LRGWIVDDTEKAQDYISKLVSTMSKMGSAALEWACHISLVAMVLLGIYAVHHLLILLFGDEGYKLFGEIPLSHFFDAADVLVIAGLLTYGVRNVVNAYRGRE
jgi:hypothetical protein